MVRMCKECGCPKLICKHGRKQLEKKSKRYKEKKKAVIADKKKLLAEMNKIAQSIRL